MLIIRYCRRFRNARIVQRKGRNGWLLFIFVLRFARPFDRADRCPLKSRDISWTRTPVAC